jgi:hypothetical protein
VQTNHRATAQSCEFNSTFTGRKRQFRGRKTIQKQLHVYINKGCNTCEHQKRMREHRDDEVCSPSCTTCIFHHVQRIKRTADIRVCMLQVRSITIGSTCSNKKRLLIVLCSSLSKRYAARAGPPSTSLSLAWPLMPCRRVQRAMVCTL